MAHAVKLAEAELFDIEEVFDDDYLYFYAPLLTAERTRHETDTLSTLLALEPGDHVLDIGCGHGRIANSLARRGYNVTGLDRTPAFLSLARAESMRAELGVDYVHGDMRDLPWRETFDAAYIWFTTFGYLDDAANQRVLASAAGALKPGGRLVIEQMNRHQLALRGVPHWNVVEVEDDLLIDKVDYDPMTDIAHTERTIVRNGLVKRASFAIRLYSPREFDEGLRRAGFAHVAIHGPGGAPFKLDGNRIIAVAQK